MKKIDRKKLAINAQTVRILTAELSAVAGGYSRDQPGCATLNAECANTNTCPKTK